MRLHIDTETFNVCPITAGTYKYGETVEITVLGYAYDDRPRRQMSMYKQQPSEQLKKDLVDPRIIKYAFNAAFEREMIFNAWGIYSPPEQWRCTMIHCAMAGLPMSLEQAAKVAGVANQKDSAGKALIRFFAIPCKPTIKNGMRTRNLPEHDPEKWEQFINYCGDDVDAERDLFHYCNKIYQISQEEQDAWTLDQYINEAGVAVDITLARNSIKLDAAYRDRLIIEAIDITGLENPNSLQQLKEWLSEQMDEEILTLKKADFAQLLESCSDDKAERVINIRQELSKTSVKKYDAIIKSVCHDGRMRGLLQYYGASRTGRAAGRIFQPQNLPRGDFDDTSYARDLVKGLDAEMLEFCYGSIPNTLSTLIRSTIVAEPGHELLVSDFSAIEARVIAWLSGEQWRLDVFETHGKIYEASASQMFAIPMSEIGKGHPLRQAGKVAELALGYQGGPNALERMAHSLGMVLPANPSSKMIVEAWRKASPNIVKFWSTCNKAAIRAISEGGKHNIGFGMYFEFKNTFLFLTLPSGRKLSYFGAKLVPGKYGEKVTYWGIDQSKKIWCRMDAYGGKFVENIVQAAARDCLYFALKNVDAAGFKIVLHVHDEIVAEEPVGGKTIEQFNEILEMSPAWGQGLPLKAEGFKTNYYKK